MSSVSLTTPWMRGRARVRSLRWPRPELSALLALALLLNLWALSRNGWANDYYSAAVRSMASSWHNFLYNSFDPSGVMTVDKPPLALWVQALSARVFGFHPLSILVPQALMGAASVGLVYDLTRRRFGRVAGFVAGLVLATTPISVAIARHNNPDALLVLCCVAALWATVRALEDGRTRWLVLAGVCVGLGFEAKMGVALLVVPAIVAAWLWVAPRGRLAALRETGAFAAAAVAVGGAWPLLIALTPASSRPWISGTNDNSILSLILDYNGFGRVDGQAGGPQAAGGGPGGGFFGGSPGPLRLLNEAFGGQAGWLLGFAVVGGLTLAVASRLRRSDRRSGWLIATGGSFATAAIVFSSAKGIVHPYYVSLLAPFTAALVGAAAGQFVRAERVSRIAAPLAVVAGVASELAVLHANPGELGGLPAVLVVAGLATAAALAWLGRGRRRSAALAVALGTLLVAPSVWAVDTLGHAANATFPAGGPSSVASLGPRAGGGFRPPSALRGGAAGGLGSGPPSVGGAPPTGALGAGPPPAGPLGAAPPAGALARPGALGGPARRLPGGFGGAGAPLGRGGPFGDDTTTLSRIAGYVRQHGGGTIAVASQSAASRSIIVSGAKVAGIGGFSGRESAVSASWLGDAVRAGRIRWVLVEGSGPSLPRDGRSGSSNVMAAAARACRAVDTTATGGATARGSTPTLYDCAGQSAALRASR